MKFLSLASYLLILLPTAAQPISDYNIKKLCKTTQNYIKCLNEFETNEGKDTSIKKTNAPIKIKVIPFKN